MKTIVKGRFGWLVLAWVILFLTSLQLVPQQGRDMTLREEAAAKGRVHKTIIIDSIGCCADFDELVHRSPFIIRGTVISAVARLSPDEKSVWTDYTVRVETVYRAVPTGITPGATIVAAQQGGSIVLDGHTVQVDVPQQPVISKDLPYIFFLGKCAGAGCGAPYLFMGDEGALSLADDSASCKSRSAIFTKFCGFSAKRFLATLEEKVHR
jgi:hypothetical protein